MTKTFLAPYVSFLFEEKIIGIWYIADNFAALQILFTIKRAVENFVTTLISEPLLTCCRCSTSTDIVN